MCKVSSSGTDSGAFLEVSSSQEDPARAVEFWVLFPRNNPRTQASLRRAAVALRVFLGCALKLGQQVVGLTFQGLHLLLKREQFIALFNVLL